MNKVKIFSLLVKDYDAAIQFYTQKVGFTLVEDKAFGESRWVTLSLPDTPGISIALELAKTADDNGLVGKQGGSFALLALDTSDCTGDYKRMKALGVNFHGEPQAGPWGTGVLFEDLYGNKIFMSQEA
jgi:predicted enzyme related to lactoylglutathione lyase